MLNQLLLILAGVAAAHSEIVDMSECIDDDRTYTSKFRFGFAMLCRPNEKVRQISSGDRCGTYDDLIPSTSGECIQRLINQCAYADINKKPDLPVIDINTKFIERTQLTPFKMLNMAGSVYVENDSELQQEGQTTQKTEQISSAFEFSMTQSIGLKTSAGFGIPLLGGTIEVSADFNFGEKWTSTTTNTITYPSQKVTVPPKSRIRLHFEVHSAKFKTTYLGTFKLDPNHELIRKCISQTRGGEVSLHLDKDGMVNGTRATVTPSQQTVNNLPITYVSDEYVVKVHISDAEPMSAVFTDMEVPTFNVLELHSANIFDKN